MDELANKIEMHLAIDEASPGFYLTKDEFRRIVVALRTVRDIASFEEPFITSTAYAMWHRARHADTESQKG